MPRDPAPPSPRDFAITILRWLLGLVFIGAGAMHFVATSTYEAIMPPYLPAPHLLVLLSGACEIAGGIGVLLPPPPRRWAGWGLVALLIAVFPANVQMAQHGLTTGSHTAHPRWATLPIRLPLQLLLIACVLAATQRPVPKFSPSPRPRGEGAGG
jgi:uncharacterized membrane protein